MLVVDEGSKRLIDNAVKEDDILNENVTSMRIADSLFYIHISSHTPYKILNRSNIDDR